MSEEINRTRNLSLLAACQLCLLLAAGGVLLCAQRYEDFTTSTPLKEGGVLIFGFMGGREAWDITANTFRCSTSATPLPNKGTR
jgi:hypothetical protein